MGRGVAGPAQAQPVPSADPQEPPWVEVLVEILLALLAQPSHLMRQVARSVFSHICSHLTPRALQLILDVSWGLWANGSRDGALRAPGCISAALLSRRCHCNVFRPPLHTWAVPWGAPRAPGCGCWVRGLLSRAPFSSLK